MSAWYSGRPGKDPPSSSIGSAGISGRWPLLVTAIMICRFDTGLSSADAAFSPFTMLRSTTGWLWLAHCEAQMSGRRWLSCGESTSVSVATGNVHVRDDKPAKG